jgi:hypothetical protein
MYVAKEAASVRQKITTARADSLRQKAIDAVKKDTRSVLELAAVLWETWVHDVKVNGLMVPLWTAWDHDSWEQYVEVELGIHMTTASNFRKMHQVYGIDLVDAIDPEAIDGLSATKLRALTKVVTKTNVNRWFKRAKKMSCCGLDEEIMEELYGTSKVGAIHTLAILCTKREQKRMRNIIQQYQSDNNLARPGAALVAILEEWDTIKNRVARRRKAAAA